MIKGIFRLNNESLLDASIRIASETILAMSDKDLGHMKVRLGLPFEISKEVAIYTYASLLCSKHAQSEGLMSQTKLGTTRFSK